MLEVKNVEHTFSVEMKSKKYVKSISISDEAQTVSFSRETSGSWWS